MPTETSQGGVGWVNGQPVNLAAGGGQRTRIATPGGGFQLPASAANGSFQPINGVDPANIANPTADFGNWRQFSDAAYQEASRQLDPQWQQQEAAFRQRMVGQGIGEGTDAYNQAWDQFSRSRNDAYDQARRSSMGVGMAAQQQGFSQEQARSQLANALAQQRMGNEFQLSLADMNNADAWNRYNLDSQFRDRQFNEDTRRWDLSRGDSLTQQDFNNLMGMNNFDFGTFQYNNDLLNQDVSRGLPFLSMIPNGGYSPIDVNGAYNTAVNAGANRAGIQQQASQQNSNNWGQVASAVGMLMLLCDRDVKEHVAAIEPSRCLDIVLGTPVEMWTYKETVKLPQVPHIGIYAQDFYAASGLPARGYIDTTDIVGVLFGAVHELARQVRELKEKAQ